MPIDMPQQMQERIVCSISAAAKYEIPANIVLAVAEKEAGRPGQWVRNANGTHDVGPLQFNTAYLAGLARFGITPADVAAAGCYPYDLASWRLRQHITKDRGDLWTRAANYHSRNPKFNGVYRADLIWRAAKWADWLMARYPAHDFALIGAAPTPSSATRIYCGELVATPAPEQTRPTTWQGATYVPRQLLVGGRP
ncbi:MAG: hypothetical protein WA191_14050 [Telluria sp.]